MFDDLYHFSHSFEVIIVTAFVAIGLPLCFHIFMFWTTRRRRFVGKEFYQEVNDWLGEMKRKYDEQRRNRFRPPPQG